MQWAPGVWTHQRNTTVDGGPVRTCGNWSVLEGEPFEVNGFRLLADRSLLSYQVESARSGE